MLLRGFDHQRRICAVVGQVIPNCKFVSSHKGDFATFKHKGDFATFKWS